jgi:hypothetical protein
MPPTGAMRWVELEAFGCDSAIANTAVPHLMHFRQ